MFWTFRRAVMNSRRRWRTQKAFNFTENLAEEEEEEKEEEEVHQDKEKKIQQEQTWNHQGGGLKDQGGWPVWEQFKTFILKS